MSCTVCGGNTVCDCGQVCETEPTPEQAAGTLTRQLVPTIDCVRDLYAELGLRSYRVALVWTQWSGGERGIGQESVLREAELLPTPLVREPRVNRMAQAIGVVEDGEVVVTQISARYTEDYLLGLGEGGAPIPLDQNFYWEVRAITPEPDVMRRRYFPKGAPQLDMERMQWTARLEKANEDRGRRGEPR